MNPERIQRQLKLAEEVLAGWVSKMDADKIPADQRKKNAKWRSLDADVRALKRRAIAVKAIEQREADAIARKAEATASAE